MFNPTDSFKSTTTHRIYKAKVPEDIKIVDCNTLNCIYLITCSVCNLQYVGETVQRVKDRFNTHRRCMKNPNKDNSANILCNHFNSGLCKRATYSVQVIEVFNGSGRDENNNVDKVATNIRRERETELMLKLRTVYPYGLNDRVGNEYRSSLTSAIALRFPKLERKHERTARVRNSRNINSDVDVILEMSSILHGDIQNAMNSIRVLLESKTKKVLKTFVTAINDFLERQTDNFPFLSWYLAALDIIECKLYKKEPPKPKKQVPKSILKVLFQNKGLDFINFQKIINMDDVISNLPKKMKDLNPVIIHTLKPSIRSKVFNYKDFTNSIDVFDNVASYPCNCEGSSFVNKDHGHIVTGDLRIVQNGKLRKLLIKGPKYREPSTIDFLKAKDSIVNGVNEFISSASDKYKIHKREFSHWKQTLLAKVDEKISVLKSRFKIRHLYKTLLDVKSQEYLHKLQEDFVLVPIDKAANNVAFICKRFYAMILLKELGLLGVPNPTYNIFHRKNLQTVIRTKVKEVKTNFKMAVSPDMKKLPNVYWTPKMHKTPVGARFIVASKECVTKEISKDVASLFKLFMLQVKKYHEKSQYFSGVKAFWVIENNTNVIQSLNSLNKKKRAKQLSTFDFSTLYTKIPHKKLLEVLTEIIEFCFKGRTKDSVKVDARGNAYWCTEKNTKDKKYFKKDVINALKFLLDNCFFTIGNKVLKQVIGIPMGGDPAPFWANLFLFYYEHKWIKRMRKTNNLLARRFTHTFRFIDDLLAINDGGMFENYYKEIYPQELELKKENLSLISCTFLDLKIDIKNNSFNTSLYDKRDDYNFKIVRLPYRSSDIPKKMFISSIVTEILRIARVTSIFQSFLTTTQTLIRRMIGQGAQVLDIRTSLNRTIKKHWEDFKKYSLSSKIILSSIFV
mgnify:CR=1 FL=1